MRRRRLLTVSAMLGFAGCLSYPERDSDANSATPTGEELVRDAIEARRRMTSLTARRVVTIETPEETVDRTERVYKRPPAKLRIEVTDSSDPSEPVGTVAVTNRTTTWEYDPETNVVERQHHPKKVDTDRTRLVLEALLSEYRLTYEGTETVDGREAHVVEAQPRSDETGPTIELLVGDSVYAIPIDPTTDLEELAVTRTVLIDDESRHPIAERNTVFDGDTLVHRLTLAYEDLSIDEGVTAGTFAYDPPDDAEIVTSGTEPDGVFDSLEAAAAAVPYDLPEPDVPDPFVLDRITVLERSAEWGTTTRLWYVDPEVTARELFVTVREVQRFNPDALEEIELDGVTGYHRDGRIKSVFWTCEDPHLSYEVSSPAVDEPEPLLEVAESIRCL